MRSKEKPLGIANKPRQYDIPLTHGAGSNHLVLLIGLMTFLAIMALTSSYVLNGMTERWTSGLQNHITIEVPVLTPTNEERTRREIKRIQTRIHDELQDHPTVTAVEIMSDDEVHNLVKPWLGDYLSLENVPLPGMITLTTADTDPQTLEIIAQKIRFIDSFAIMDDHKTWLKDLLSFTGALQFASSVLLLVIGATAIIAIAGTMRSRVAMHKEDVELLHLMGASDSYISRQFQNYALILSFKGAIVGAMLGGFVLIIINYAISHMDLNLIPDFRMSIWQTLSFATVPFLAALVAAITSGQTVLHVLSKMP